MKLMRRVRRILWPALIGVSVVAGVVFAFTYPVLAAVACPPCFGLERAGIRLIVDKDMPEAMRRQLAGSVQEAGGVVRAFYGVSTREAYVVACHDKPCDMRLGGGGARAVTFSTPWLAAIRVSPHGIDTTTIAHELAHVELHKRIGVMNLLKGVVPAWFDEGLAVVISNDRSFIGRTKDGATCRDDAERSLPATAAEWAKAAGRRPMIYADAACRVMDWMARNGGHAGVLAAIGQAGHGGALKE